MWWLEILHIACHQPPDYQCLMTNDTELSVEQNQKERMSDNSTNRHKSLNTRGFGLAKTVEHCSSRKPKLTYGNQTIRLGCLLQWDRQNDCGWPHIQWLCSGAIQLALVGSRKGEGEVAAYQGGVVATMELTQNFHRSVYGIERTGSVGWAIQTLQWSSTSVTFFACMHASCSFMYLVASTWGTKNIILEQPSKR